MSLNRLFSRHPSSFLFNTLPYRRKALRLLSAMCHFVKSLTKASHFSKIKKQFSFHRFCTSVSTLYAWYSAHSVTQDARS